MVTHLDLTWLDYIIETPNGNIMEWHDSSTLQIHPGINIRLQYIRNTSEYILKLQLHQQLPSGLGGPSGPNDPGGPEGHSGPPLGVPGGPNGPDPKNQSPAGGFFGSSSSQQPVY